MDCVREMSAGTAAAVAGPAGGSSGNYGDWQVGSVPDY